MKKFDLSILVLFTITSFYAQEKNITKDTIALEEVLITKTVSNKKIIKSFVKKIKKNLWENYNLGSVNYETNHFSIKDDKDTLVNRRMQNNLDLSPLNHSSVKKNLLQNPKNPFKTDVSPYDRFEPSVSNNDHWLALLIYYDSLHVLDFDFFNNILNYNYKIVTQDNITTVSFTAIKYYTGYFSFNNKNFNLIRIAFSNTEPYNSYSSGFIGSRSNIEFDAKWKLNKVTILLDFKETDKGKLLLAKLNAMQELTQFEFKRYLTDPRRVIDQDRNLKFYTTLSMRLIE